MARWTLHPGGYETTVCWVWSVKRCSTCHLPRYRYERLCSVLRREQADGTYQYRSRPVGDDFKMYPGAYPALTKRAPVLSCKCPGVRGPSPSWLTSHASTRRPRNIGQGVT